MPSPLSSVPLFPATPRWALGRCTWAAVGLAVASVALAAPPEVASDPAQREATALTVYNQDLGLVKERRRVVLPHGVARLSWREVSG